MILVWVFKQVLVRLRNLDYVMFELSLSLRAACLCCGARLT